MCRAALLYICNGSSPRPTVSYSKRRNRKRRDERETLLLPWLCCSATIAIATGNGPTGRPVSLSLLHEGGFEYITLVRLGRFRLLYVYIKIQQTVCVCNCSDFTQSRAFVFTIIWKCHLHLLLLCPTLKKLIFPQPLPYTPTSIFNSPSLAAQLKFITHRFSIFSPPTCANKSPKASMRVYISFLAYR